MFKALGDENRRKMVEILLLRGSMPVNDFLPYVDCLQPTVSIHLGILTDANLVKLDYEEGRQRFYTLTDNYKVAQLLAIGEEFND